MPKIPTQTPDTQVSGVNRVNIPQGANPLSVVASGLGDFAQAQDNINKRDAAAYVANAYSDFQINEMKEFENAKTQYGIDELSEKYLNDYTTRAQQFIEGAPNEYAKVTLTKRLMANKDNAFAKAISYQAQQKNKLRLESLGNSKKNYQTLSASDPLNAPTYAKDFEGDVLNAEETKTISNGVNFAEQGKRDIVRSGLDSLLFSNPEMAKESIEKGYYANFLTEPEKQNFLNLADKRIEFVKQRAEYTNLTVGTQEIADLYTNIANQEANALQVNTGLNLTPEYREYFNKELNGEFDINPNYNDKSFTGLYEKVMSLSLKQSKGNPIQDKEEVYRLINEVKSARESKQINKTDAARLTTKLSKWAVKAASEETATGDSDYDIGYGRISQFFAQGSKADDYAARAEAYRYYVTALDKLSADTGKQDAAVYREASQMTIDNYIRKKYPEYSAYKELPQNIIDKVSNDVVPVNPNIYSGKVDRSVSIPDVVNIPRVTSKTEFDKLPSGAQYYEPDGKLYRKP